MYRTIKLRTITKKFISMLSLALVFSVIAAMSVTPCFAASDTGNSTIAVSNQLGNVAIAGDVDISTFTTGANYNVTSAVQNTIAGLVAGGNLNIDNISMILGGNVTDVATNTISGAAIGGDLNINNLAEILGPNTTAAFGNTIYNFAGRDGTINSIINSNGVSAASTEAIQNTLLNAIFKGSLAVTNVAK